MRRFRCRCGQWLYFDNTACMNCGATLGFLPGSLELLPLDPRSDGTWMAGGTPVRQCLHYHRDHVCNWLVPADDPDPFCESCRLNAVIPNLSLPENPSHWARLEAAKRSLLYELRRLGLPLTPRSAAHPRGLGFAFMEDDDNQQVLTGHAGGLITINIREADDAYRETMRKRLGEPYRTLLGHFRHESGHFYWEHLVATDADRLARFRALFGDERQDYAMALERHYSQAQVPWSVWHITAYAAAHPWEDWAETWSHYLLLRDTLETAGDLGLQQREDPDLQRMLAHWRELSVLINALGRSLGMPSLYPFVHTEQVAEKLGFIHDLLQQTRHC